MREGRHPWVQTRSGLSAVGWPGFPGVPGVPFPTSSTWYRNGHAQGFRAFHRKRFHLVRGEIGLFPPDLDEHGADRPAAAGAEDGQLTSPTHTRSVRPRARSHSVSATQGHFTPWECGSTSWCRAEMVGSRQGARCTQYVSAGSMAQMAGEEDEPMAQTKKSPRSGNSPGQRGTPGRATTQ